MLLEWTRFGLSLLLFFRSWGECPNFGRLKALSRAESWKSFFFVTGEFEYFARCALTFAKSGLDGFLFRDFWDSSRSNWATPGYAFSTKSIKLLTPELTNGFRCFYFSTAWIVLTVLVNFLSHKKFSYSNMSIIWMQSITFSLKSCTRRTVSTS